MRIKNKIFPYPMLNNNKNLSDYINSSFGYEFDRDDNGGIITKNGKLIFKNIKFNLNNEKLMNLYIEGKLRCVFIIECSSTLFRKSYELTTEPKDISTLIRNLNNDVYISSFIYALQDIDDFSNEDFSSDFEGYKFSIEKNDIIAADDGYKFNIDIDDKEDNKVSSIFSIAISDANEKIVTYDDTDGKKIKIFLSKENYKHYDSMKNDSSFNNVFFAMLIVPVLSSCLMDIQNRMDTWASIEDIYEEKKWFKSISKRYNHIHGNGEFEYDTFKDLNCYQLAQELMGNCTCQGMKDFFDLTMNNTEDIDDE